MHTTDPQPLAVVPPPPPPAGAPPATPADTAPTCALVVLDTNVLLDWLVFDDAAVHPLVQALQAGQLQWLATADMLAELAAVLCRPLGARWENQRLAAMNIDLRPWHLPVDTVLPGADRRLWCSDKDDQKFIDLALARRARWLVTHDHALLRLARRARAQGLEVLRPRDWTQISGKQA